MDDLYYSSNVAIAALFRFARMPKLSEKLNLESDKRHFHALVVSNYPSGSSLRIATHEDFCLKKTYSKMQNENISTIIPYHLCVQ